LLFKLLKKKFPDVILLAEVYYPYQETLQQLGFDYTYDKTLLDDLASFNLGSVKNWITSNSVSFMNKSAHFLSNHDEPRAVPKFSGVWYKSDAAALFTYTLPGMRFFWMWDEFGFSNKLDVHLRREATEPELTQVQSFYKQLLGIVTTHEVFRNGTWEFLSVNNDPSGALMAWSWYNDQEKILCVMNFSEYNEAGTIVVSNAEPVNGNDTIPVTDLLSGDVYYRSAEEMRTSGLQVVINSWYAQIFLYN